MGLRPPKVMKNAFCPATTFHENVTLSFVIPERTRISYFTALTSATYVVLPKENHMQLSEAAALDRKSGGAEGSAVPRTFPGNVFRICGPTRSTVSINQVEPGTPPLHWAEVFGQFQPRVPCRRRPAGCAPNALWAQ
jgi:hypothetical protein